MAAGLSDIVTALKIWPWRGKAWMALFATLFGARAYEFATSWMERAQRRPVDRQE